MIDSQGSKLSWTHCRVFFKFYFWDPDCGLEAFWSVELSSLLLDSAKSSQVHSRSSSTEAAGSLGFSAACQTLASRLRDLSGMTVP